MCRGSPRRVQLPQTSGTQLPLRRNSSRGPTLSIKAAWSIPPVTSVHSDLSASAAASQGDCQWCQRLRLVERAKSSRGALGRRLRQERLNGASEGQENAEAELLCPRCSPTPCEPAKNAPLPRCASPGPAWTLVSREKEIEEDLGDFVDLGGSPLRFGGARHRSPSPTGAGWTLL